jgi:serine/threonine-protein kinase RsbW
MEIRFTLSLPRDEASVPVARHVCRDALVRLGVMDDCVSDVEVAVTEACTNVLKHAAGTDEQYELTFTINESNCEIRVVDGGTGWEHSAERVSHPESESGRGIVLMSALVDDLEFISEPEAGTVVHLVKRLEFMNDSIIHRLNAAPARG